MKSNEKKQSVSNAEEPKAKPKSKRGGKRTTTKPICGATSRNTGKPCPHVSGYGTDHLGSGRCKFHGGCTPSKSGIYSSVIPAEYRDQYEALRQAPNTNSLNDELAYLRMVLMRLEKKHGGKEAVPLGMIEIEPLEMISECIEKISRVVKRKNDMEEGTKITFSLSDLKEFSEAVIQAVIKHVSDPNTVAAIKQELAAYFAGQNAA